MPATRTGQTTHLTIADLSARLGIPLSTIYQWNYLGQAPKRIRIGRHVRYRIEDVEAWEAEHLVAGPDPGP